MKEEEFTEMFSGNQRKNSHQQWGAYVYTEEIKKDSALIKAEITVENDLYEMVEARAEMTVYNTDNNSVGKISLEKAKIDA
jgi:hypothetical protein